MDLNRQEVKTKDDFIKLLNKLSSQNVCERKNILTSDFLEAMAAWLADCDGFYANHSLELNSENASWQLFADAVSAAEVYE